MSSSVSVQSGSVGTSQNWFEAALEAARARRTAWASPSLAALQSKAEETWKKLLFPTPRIEAWKYTSTDDIAKGSFVLPGAQSQFEVDEAALALSDVPAWQIVFVNGTFVASLSTKETLSGAVVTRIAELSGGTSEAVASKLGSSGAHLAEPFTALATSLLSDGVCVEIAAGAVVERPIHIINVVTAAGSRTVVTPRVLVVAGERAEVKIIESHVAQGGEGYLSLPVCEVIAGAGAIVDYYRVQRDAPSAYHVSFLAVSQEAGSSVNAHISSFGGKLVRNNAEVALRGSGAQSVLNGLTVLTDGQHVDNATLIHHIAPSAESREHFKGIYADRSRGVFSGTITVEQDAQKTNAFQSNQALLLSPDASIESRPQLKIWADDVKCTHGATVGQLDQDALFYLRSRGIDRETARNFLVHAFASEVLSSIRLEGVRGHVEAILSQKLDALAA